jgi:hypothetical protein
LKSSNAVSILYLIIYRMFEYKLANSAFQPLI